MTNSKVLHSKTDNSKHSKVKCEISSVHLCQKRTCNHNCEKDHDICNTCFCTVLPFSNLDNNEVR